MDKLGLSKNLSALGTLDVIAHGRFSTGVEKILFSDLLTKVNRKGRLQKRLIAISNFFIYVAKPELKKVAEVKRRISLKYVEQITINSAINEFIIHVPREYDYHFRPIHGCSTLADIVDALRLIIYQSCFVEVPSVIVDLKNVRGLLLTKQEGLKGSHNIKILQRGRIMQSKTPISSATMGEYYRWFRKPQSEEQKEAAEKLKSLAQAQGTLAEVPDETAIDSDSSDDLSELSTVSLKETSSPAWSTNRNTNRRNTLRARFGDDEEGDSIIIKRQTVVTSSPSRNGPLRAITRSDASPTASQESRKAKTVSFSNESEQGIQRKPPPDPPARFQRSQTVTSPRKRSDLLQSIGMSEKNITLNSLDFEQSNNPIFRRDTAMSKDGTASAKSSDQAEAEKPTITPPSIPQAPPPAPVLNISNNSDSLPSKRAEAGQGRARSKTSLGNEILSHHLSLAKQEKFLDISREQTITSTTSSPSSWREMIDSRTGRMYYFNPNTNETRWDKPKGDSDDGDVSNNTAHLQDLLAGMPFFRGTSNVFMERVIKALRHSQHVPGTIICNEGTVGLKMFLILKGSVDIVKNGKKIKTLHDGAYFGEIAVLMESKRTADVIVSEKCDLLSISREEFQLIIAEFPEEKRRFREISEKRLRALEEVNRQEHFAGDDSTFLERRQQAQEYSKSVANQLWNKAKSKLMGGVRMANILKGATSNVTAASSGGGTTEKTPSTPSSQATDFQSSDRKDSLPLDWDTAEMNGKVYYYNRKTRQSQWEKPTQ